MAPTNLSTSLSTPSQRPLAEPPIFNYQTFVLANNIPSDVRLRRLFRKNIAMGWEWRDQLTEKELHFEYLYWARCMVREEKNDSDRCAFFTELAIDLGDLKHEHFGLGKAEGTLRKALNTGVISWLDVWEFYHLDEDGGMVALRKRLERGDDVFAEGWGVEFGLGGLGGMPDGGGLAFEKYGFLAVGELYGMAKKRYDGQQKERNLVHSKGDKTLVSPPLQVPDDNTAAQTGDERINDRAAFLPTDTSQLEAQLSVANSENVALRKRTAELELEYSAAKRQRSFHPCSQQ